jgi:3-deoxy-alpha-D-manno-octulosonate 8-oxidase
MIYTFRNFRTVAYFAFGRGTFDRLDEILAPRRKARESYVVFLVDDVFRSRPLRERIPLRGSDRIVWVSVEEEPTTCLVDRLRDEILGYADSLPDAVVGIGGGSVMDIAKAVALMLTNPGSSAGYQGLDLIQNPGVFKVCIPTLSGTGAEVSMTSVLVGPEKKLGIKCDYTMPDQVVLDPDLIAGAPREQRFYTGMDCYIHAVESLNGTWRNAYSDAFAEKSLSLCREVFLASDGPSPEADEKLMIASYLGGMSVTYSQVGVCHALSYGLSFVLHTRHGLANCIAFNRLEDVCPEGVREFHAMVERQGIELPEGLTAGLPDGEIDRMVNTALRLEHMWDHAFGKSWREKVTPEWIRGLFLRM